MEVREDYRPELITLGWFSDGDDGDSSADDDDKKSSQDAPDDDVSKVTDKEVDDIVKEGEIDGMSDTELRIALRKQIKATNKVASIARDRLHEIMDKKQKLKDIEDTKEKARLDELAKKEEYKTALDEIQPKYNVLKDDVAKTHAFFEQQLEDLKASLDEQYHDLIPEGDIRSQIGWIQKFQKKLSTSGGGTGDQTKQKKTVGGGEPPDGTKTGETSPDQIKKMIDDTKSPAELEELLSSFKGKV